MSNNLTVGKILFAGVVLAIGAAAVANAVADSNAPPATTTQRPLYVPPAEPALALTSSVTYEVTGTDMDVTMQTPSGTVQKTGLKHFRQTLIFEPGDFVYISAQDSGSGTHTCTITSDGVRVASNSSSGQYSIVTCKGSA